MGDSNSPLLELRVDHSVGESLPADTDALKHTVAPQLMQHKFSLQDTLIKGKAIIIN